MVGPTQLFSMLTQASAGIVGFIVSFGAVLYTLERQRRERRTERLRKELRDFKDTYEGVIDAMWLDTATGPSSYDYLDEVDLEQPEDQLRHTIEDRTNKVDQTLFSLHLIRLRRLFENINPENDHILSEGEFQQLWRSIRWVALYLDANNREQNKQLYVELANIVSPDSIKGDHYMKDVLSEETGERIRYWLQNVADGRHHSWAGYRPHDPSLTGRNLFSLATVMEYIDQDHDTLSAHINGTLVGYSPGIKTIVRLAAVLTLFGVFIPLLFVLKLPDELSMFVIGGWTLFFVQVVLLITNAALVISLIEIILSGIGSESELGELDDVSPVCRVTIGVVERVSPF